MLRLYARLSRVRVLQARPTEQITNSWLVTQDYRSLQTQDYRGIRLNLGLRLVTQDNRTLLLQSGDQIDV
jgi:hypothetical protein